VAEFVLDFLLVFGAMCERDIFGVDPEQEQKGILCWFKGERRFFLHKNTHTTCLL